MHKRIILLIAGAVLAVGGVSGYFLLRGDTAKLPEMVSFGPTPKLGEPVKQLVPTVNVAPAKGWPEGAKPAAASGFTVTAFATGLDHPRWLHVLPNGDVLVAESNAPPRPEEGKSPKGMIYRAAQAR